MDGKAKRLVMRDSFYPKFLLSGEEASPPEKTAAEKLTEFFNIGLRTVGSAAEGDLLKEDVIIVGCSKSNPVVKTLFEKGLFDLPENWRRDSEEGMILKGLPNPYGKGKRLIMVSGSGPRGVLYAAYMLMERLRIHRSIPADLDMVEQPRFTFRAYWQPSSPVGKKPFTWDLLRHPEGTWFEDLISLVISHRANTYILGTTTVMDIEGHSVQTMVRGHASDLAGVARLLSKYGLELYLSFPFEDQEWITQQEEAGDPYPFCPYNPRLESYWRGFVRALNRGCPPFKGMVLKGAGIEARALWDCGCDKCQSKSRLQRMIDSLMMIYKVLKEFDKKLIYRTWQSGNSDDEYRDFAPLVGKIPDEIAIHSKSAFWDHMAYTAPHPLLGKVYPVNDAITNLDGSAEYTAGNHYPNCMVERWKDRVKYCEDKVSGFGVWIGCFPGEAHLDKLEEKMNPLSFVNWYGAGRLMWNPDQDTDEILTDWIALTYRREVVPYVRDLLKKSEDWCDCTFQVRGLCGVYHARMIDSFYCAEMMLGCTDRPNIATRGDGMIGYERDIGVFSPEVAREIVEDPRLRMFFTKEEITPRVRDEALREKDRAVSLCQGMIDDWKKTQPYLDPEVYQSVLESLELALNDTMAWRDWTEIYFDYRLGKLTRERASQLYQAHKGKKRSGFTLDLFERFVVDVAKRIPREGTSSETLLDRAIERTGWETLDRYLERMDRFIDLRRIAEKEQLYRALWDYESGSRPPRIVLTPHLYPYAERNEVDLSEWDTPPYTQGMLDKDRMIVNGLARIYVNMVLGDDALPVLRAEYGPGCIPTMFGCKTRFTKLIWKHIGVHDYEPPDVLPLDLVSIKRVIESGIPDFTRGFGGKVLEVEAYFVETLGEYASLRQAVHIALCDMQGPFDLAYLMLGDRIYGDVRDHPNMVAELLDLLTETFIQFAGKQKRIIGEESDASYQWEGYWAKGGVKITDNAAARLSGEMYERFCIPHNQRILQEFGGESSMLIRRL